MVALRDYLRLSVDDLLVVAKEFLHSDLSRSALQRLLRRRGLPSLAALEKQEKAAQQSLHKPFKAYEPGFVHIDVKHLPQMPDEDHKRYLFVAIDRATHWVYLEVRQHQSVQDADAFLQHVRERAPFRIRTLLTDNGKTFIDRFAAGGERQPSGMVERFNGRVSDVLNTHQTPAGAMK
ncbi:integrase-like protein [Modicisalibacter xianhensis]|uniref:Integrase-like protein n=1 Tax=Modicisalibacter xianhensis TaxID=442341 RepID=A0A4R8FC24_9GAMM|nr:integrase-like protein [Halomonas xianhensis]